MNEQLYREAEHRLWQDAGATPKEHHIKLPWQGARVRVQEVGEGPPVLFVHGGPNSGSTWAYLAARLQQFRCLIVDRPGTGLSDTLDLDRKGLDAFVRQFVAEVLDGLGVDRADLVGSSFGGYIALQSALATPERVGRIVQMGAPPMIPGGTVPLFMRLMAIPGLHRLVAALPPSAKQSISTFRQIGHGASIDAGRIPKAFMDWYLALLRYTPTMRSDLGIISGAMTRRGFDPSYDLTAQELASISAPTYFLWGENEPFGSEEVGRALVKAMPRAELELLPGAGHLPWLDDPDHAATVVARFLAREDALPGA
jgi:2-hydroxy-6-oxonona-2,4-dienedioate hydrolase